MNKINKRMISGWSRVLEGRGARDGYLPGTASSGTRSEPTQQKAFLRRGDTSSPVLQKE